MEERAVGTWKKLLLRKENAQTIRFALTGDGSGASTADVNSRPGFAWVRYDEEPNKVAMVRNRWIPGVGQDVAVIIGKRYPTNKEVEILGINAELYDGAWNQDQFISYVLPAHGPTHHAVYGTDPAELDIRNILNGKVIPTDPASLGVTVEPLAYMAYGQRMLFGGGGLTFTGDVPGTVNYQRYALVTLNIVEGRLHKILGVSNPVTIAPTPPDCPIWNIPLGLVLLYYGQTTVEEANIYEYRVAFQPVGLHQVARDLMRYMEHQEMLWDLHLTGEI